MGILLVAGGFLVAGQLGMVGGAWAVFFSSLPKELTLIIPDTLVPDSISKLQDRYLL